MTFMIGNVSQAKFLELPRLESRTLTNGVRIQVHPWRTARKNVVYKLRIKHSGVEAHLDNFLDSKLFHGPASNALPKNSSITSELLHTSRVPRAGILNSLLVSDHDADEEFQRLVDEFSYFSNADYMSPFCDHTVKVPFPVFAVPFPYMLPMYRILGHCLEGISEDHYELDQAVRKFISGQLAILGLTFDHLESLTDQMVANLPKCQKTSI